MNSIALKVLGKDLDEIVGKKYSDVSLYPPGSPSDPIKALHEGRDAEVLYVEENSHYYIGVANYLYDQSGEKTGYIIMSGDITEIEISRQKAEQASVAKGNFLSNMSHEIRTPLNAIIGMTSIGTASPDTEKKDYSLKKINEASKHLLGIINDILDVSKIEANKYSLSIASFELEEMILRVVDVINFRVEQKKQRLTVHIDPNMPETLIGDDQRLAQVITNLLSNAVKSTAEEGSIHLEMMLEDENEGQCTILVAVSDTGIGISQEQQKRLFESFEQAEASTSRRFGGTGLGLVICKGIIEMMDGKIWVDSELGDGAIVSFTAKLGYERSGQKKGLAQDDAENIRFLIADDDIGTRVFFEEMTVNHGVVCDIVPNGERALSMIEENEEYSLFFVALKLSDMSGFELAKAITEGGQNRKVVLMVSRSDWSAYQERALEAGVATHIAKPLFVASVIDCANEQLFSDDLAEEAIEEESADFAGKTILLVEDVEINREIVMALLEPTNLSIDCAENGIKAVDAFVSNPKKYDLIFMDIQMPEMDGFTATRMIRDSGVPRAKEVPIVAMTANAFKEDIDKSIESGMNDHLGKPLSYDLVIETLEKYLHGK